ncbi:hypothetical protein HMPREF0766_12651 [Sphingobacterium spiritivorum ATCC 33861]|uniref:Uncharacterized protein n=2 Tax=Sphingobacterium spiritivorum TaxID=258 RepID=D7VNT1_SPHSI|nr:hypothetical protein HMPREF0766_12651 [Sphingobacterium spiritivorum ATCC 33861]
MLVVELLYCLMGCSMMQVNPNELYPASPTVFCRNFTVCSLQPSGILF